MTTTTQTDINTNTTANNIVATVGCVSTGTSTGNGTVGSGDVDNIVGSPLTSSNRNSNGHTNSSNNFYSNSSNSNSNIGNNGSTTAATTNNQRAMNESNKRKKLKSRTATVPSGGHGHGHGHGHSHSHGHGEGYVKDHLDAWLETCLKDASNTQLSSSSEFLDYNPTPPGTTGTGGDRSIGANPQKFIQQQMQQRHQHNNQHAGQQQQQQRDHHNHHEQQNSTYLSNQSLNNANQQTQFPYSQQQQQQHSAHQTQQQFGSRTGPMSFTGGYMASGSVPFSQGFQRNVPNYIKQSHYNNRFSMMFPHSSMGPAPGGYYQQSDGQDFASLPPIVNMMGGSSEMENNSTDVLDGSGSNPNISRGFRFSDPCLLNPSDNDSKVSGQNTPDRRNQIPSDLENNKFFAALMEQINILHETNTKICRNLHETKGAYTPGMMTDVVREVKEAARVREDALLNRVKAMVEERQWTMNENNLRMLRDIEELKSQVHHLRADRKESNKRITHLEAENKYMRQMLTSLFNQRNTPDVIYENETLRTQRKSFPTRRSQSMNLHYGTIHHQPPAVGLLVDEQDERLHIVEGTTTRAANMVTVSDGRAPAEMRSSFSSSDGGGSVGAVSVGGGLGGSESVHKSGTTAIGICTVTPLPNGNGTTAMATNQQLMSPPNFALVSTPVEDEEEEQLKQRKRKGKKVPNVDVSLRRNGVNDAGRDGNDASAEGNVNTQELQQELQDAVAARKEADKRVIALENMVRTLRLDSTNTKANLSINNITSNHPTASIEYNLINGTGSASGAGTAPSPGVESFALVNRFVGDSSNINPCTTTNTQQRLTTIVQPQQKQHRAHTIVSTSSIGYVAQTPTEYRNSSTGPITDL